MRYLRALLSLAVFVGVASTVQADEVSRRAKVEQLFEAVHLDQMVPQLTQQIMDQMWPMIAKQGKELPAQKIEALHKALTVLMTEQLNWQKLKPMYVKIYADTYTEEEIAGIADFYKTPAGQALLKKTPLLSRNMMKSMQELMGSMMNDLPRILERIDKAETEPTKP